MTDWLGDPREAILAEVLSELPSGPVETGDATQTSQDSPTHPGEKVFTEPLGVPAHRSAEMQAAIQRVQMRDIPRGRALKPWEPQSLNPVHLQMVMLRAAGMGVSEIAKMFEYEVARVSVILRHPDAEWLLSKAVSLAAESVLDVQGRIQAASGEMLDIVLEVTRTTQDEKLKSANAFEMLALAGYTAKPQTRGGVGEVMVPKEAFSHLAAALSESNEIKNPVYNIIPEGFPSTPTGEGRELGDTPGSEAVSGPPRGAADVPPSSDAPSPLERVA